MPSILVVDDDCDLLRVTRQFLEINGYGVFCAENGTAAMKILEQEKVDLVITDMLMPGMDGIELLMALRQKPASPPVIVMSGGSIKINCDYLLGMAQTLNVQRTMKKPFDYADLHTVICDELGIMPTYGTA